MSADDAATAFYVYWIQSASRAYIGATVDLRKRLRQHNGELVGGAARTRNRGPWKYQMVVSGFRTWREALQYEWAAKYHTKACRGIKSRRDAIEALNARTQWTSNAPLASDVPLVVEHEPSRYGVPPGQLPSPQQPGASRRRSRQKSRRGFVKTLHGVHY